MTRLAQHRDTHLTPGEIVAETLGQFDAGGAEPSIRSLAGALRVAPSAIYHHFSSRAEIYQAAVDVVWAQATHELHELVPTPLHAQPAETLVAGGIATRRAWLAHHRLSPYMAASPRANDVITNAFGLTSSLFERLGLESQEAAAAFHTYSSFMIGSVLFAASQKAVNLQLAADAGTGGSAQRPGQRREEALSIPTIDPTRDEQLFAQGLRRLVGSFP